MWASPPEKYAEREMLFPVSAHPQSPWPFVKTDRQASTPCFSSQDTVAWVSTLPRARPPRNGGGEATVASASSLLSPHLVLREWGPLLAPWFSSVASCRQHLGDPVDSGPEHRNKGVEGPAFQLYKGQRL